MISNVNSFKQKMIMTMKKLKFKSLVKDNNFKMFMNKKHRSPFKMRNRNCKLRILFSMHKQLKIYMMKLILKCNSSLKLTLSLKLNKFNKKLIKN